jgi:hypothetical protein
MRMMSDEPDKAIAQQRTLLATQRRTLAMYLHQTAARDGMAYCPPALVSGWPVLRFTPVEQK